MSLQFTQVAEVTADDFRGAAPAVSPDGRHVAVSANSACVEIHSLLPSADGSQHMELQMRIAAGGSHSVDVGEMQVSRMRGVHAHASTYGGATICLAWSLCSTVLVVVNARGGGHVILSVYRVATGTLVARQSAFVGASWRRVGVATAAAAAASEQAKVAFSPCGRYAALVCAEIPSSPSDSVNQQVIVFTTHDWRKTFFTILSGALIQGVTVSVVPAATRGGSDTVRVTTVSTEGATGVSVTLTHVTPVRSPLGVVVSWDSWSRSTVLPGFASASLSPTGTHMLMPSVAQKRVAIVPLPPITEEDPSQMPSRIQTATATFTPARVVFGPTTSSGATIVLSDTLHYVEMAGGANCREGRVALQSSGGGAAELQCGEFFQAQIIGLPCLRSYLVVSKDVPYSGVTARLLRLVEM